MWITFITDQRPGEPDILTPVKHGRLVIRDLAGDEIFARNAPETGWTHELLVEVQPSCCEGGANAYLNNSWIGSTEV
ncbi:TPA: hypothetical protein MN540_005071 [Klebsiella pneumoniae]|nr:hypothetical protein [Klebsiella pneumoniae]